MNKMKSWFLGTALGLSVATGVQFARPPTMDMSSTPKQVAEVLASQSGPSIGPEQTPAPVDIHTLLMHPTVKLGQVSGASTNELTMISRSADEANQVLGSDCFKKNVLTFNFSERNIYESNIQLSNEQIYDLQESKLVFFGVNIFNGSFYQNYISKTMGYDIGDGVVYVNRHFATTPEIIGALILHEAQGHGQGFHHYGFFGTSVPYKMDDFFNLCLGKQ